MHSLKQSPFTESNRTHLVKTLLLLNLEVHYSVHRNPPLEIFVSHLNPAYILRPYSLRYKLISSFPLYLGLHLLSSFHYSDYFSV
jgi:hypothetical protein